MSHQNYGQAHRAQDDEHRRYHRPDAAFTRIPSCHLPSILSVPCGRPFRPFDRIRFPWRSKRRPTPYGLRALYPLSHPLRHSALARSTSQTSRGEVTASVMPGSQGPRWRIGCALCTHWAWSPTLFGVTVRQKIDQLTSEPAVGDLGYSADQRLVASVMLGLQLLADEIDDMKERPAAPAEPKAVEGPVDVGTQLSELTEQIRKLTKAVKKASKNR